MNGQFLVRASGMTCAYGRSEVLSGVDLVVDPGDYIGVVGPSGSGKTTLLLAMTGSVDPVAGSVERARDVRIGYVPQVETIDWSFPVTVAEVISMARPGRGWPWLSPSERRQVGVMLERLGLGGLGSRHIRELSGGQQQRVFIARALLSAPDLLLLDEPTAGVDVRTRHEVLHLLGELNSQGLTVVLTTHDLNGVATHLPKIVCLNTRVIAAGSPSDVLVPWVLEQTYGAQLEVLEHGGMRVVVDPGSRSTVAL